MQGPGDSAPAFRAGLLIRALKNAFVMSWQWLNSESKRNYRSALDKRVSLGFLVRGLRMIGINHKDSFLGVGL